MARPRRAFPKVTGEQAIAALRWLVASGKIEAKHIADALRQREDLVREIRERLGALGDEGFRLLKDGPFPMSASSSRPANRRRKASAKARAAWISQGRYLGAIRQLSAANRARVKKIRETKGIRALSLRPRGIAIGDRKSSKDVGVRLVEPEK